MEVGVLLSMVKVTGNFAQGKRVYPVQSITCNCTGKPLPCATLHTLTMILCKVAHGSRQVGVLWPPEYDMNFQLQPGTLEAFAMFLQFLQRPCEQQKRDSNDCGLACVNAAATLVGGRRLNREDCGAIIPESRRRASGKVSEVRGGRRKGSATLHRFIVILCNVRAQCPEATLNRNMVILCEVTF
jgi:hypothetical protein